MDVAYDNIQREAYPSDQKTEAESKDGKSEGASSDQANPNTLNADIQEAYKAISNSPWAARIGGFWGNVRKQGEQYIETAKKEYSSEIEQASQGFTSILNRTRGLSIAQPFTSDASASSDPSSSAAASAEAPATDKDIDSPAHPDRPESLPADIIKEASGLFSRFRSVAQERLKEVQKAEEAADEALLKFGSNIREFWRDAVTIAPPQEGADASKVLFESKDAEGRRVIHTTRFDAQLHVIHSSLDSFLKDPVSPEWKPWADKFDAKAHTDTIAKDLEKYEELRRAMEKVVPEKVEYTDFWKRYYFLRHVIQTEEKRRKEMLQASTAQAPDEEVAWDEDSDEEEEEDEEEDEDSDEEEDDDSDDEEDDSDEDDSATQKPTHPLAASKDTLKPGTRAQAKPQPPQPKAPAAPAPTQPKAAAAAAAAAAKPTEPRRSNDQHSQADSDASYDLVSGATSRAQGSPRDPKDAGKKKEVVVEEEDEDDDDEEESDEDDWE